MGIDAGTYQLIGGIGSGVATAGNAYTQANAMRLQGDYSRRMGNLNARMAGIQADDAIWAGEQEAQRLGIRTRQLIGEQRASAAAQGVNVNSGSPLSLQANAAALSALDQATIRNNAWKQAMGLHMQQSSEYARAQMAYNTGRSNANSTLLAGGTNALGRIGNAAYTSYAYTPPMQVPTYDLSSKNYLENSSQWSW